MSEITWQDLKLTSQYIKALDELGYQVPTLIQEKAIPQIISGQKVIGIAQTGTGKTAAYILPIFHKLKYAQGVQPRALILVPTKELVIQIATNCKLISKYTDLRTIELYGGVGPKQQKELLAQGSDVIVATPGRFLELYISKDILTKLIKTLVIDEADRMMDLNFMPQLRKIFEVLPPKRQDLLFSATFSKKVENLAGEFIDFPMKIEVTPQASVTSKVTQSLYQTLNFHTKLNLLVHLLGDQSFSKVIVFCRKKETVVNLEKYLLRSSVGTIKSIHSNKSQNSRINSINEFGSGVVRILISTDVAARGIDIKEVSHVINFDVPMLYEDYTHRIGRTGRAEHHGMAVTFATNADMYHIKRIEKLIGQKIPAVRLPESVEVTETPYAEAQKIAREIDHQKRLEDPEYKGAFHERKK